jgi:hypothetical protein
MPSRKWKLTFESKAAKLQAMSIEKDDPLRDELAQQGSFLPADASSQGLRVPEDYFADLEERILQRLSAEGVRRPSSTASRFHLRAIGRWAAAAAAVSVLVFWWAHRQRVSADQKAASAMELSTDDIATYLLARPEMVDPQELSAVLPVEMWMFTPLDSADGAPSWELFLRDLSTEELDKLNL